MSNARPTATVKTAAGHELVYHIYLTAGDKRQITEIYMEAGDTTRKPVEGEKRAFFRATDKTLELVIVTLDGSADNIIGRILELPSTEADEIEEIVKEVVDPKKK